MPAVEVDFRWFPLILQRWPDDSVSDAELTTFFGVIEGAARRAQQSNTFYVVVGRGQPELDAGQRRRIGRWVRSLPKEIRERSLGSFLVIESPMQRGILTALRWLMPELREVFTHETLPLAVDAAISALHRRGIAAPAAAAEIVRYAGEGKAAEA